MILKRLISRTTIILDRVICSWSCLWRAHTVLECSNHLQKKNVIRCLPLPVFLVKATKTQVWQWSNRDFYEGRGNDRKQTNKHTNLLLLHCRNLSALAEAYKKIRYFIRFAQTVIIVSQNLWQKNLISPEQMFTFKIDYLWSTQYTFNFHFLASYFLIINRQPKNI